MWHERDSKIVCRTLDRYRDSKFTPAFDAVFGGADIRIIPCGVPEVGLSL
jgi:hypothetical protein